MEENGQKSKGSEEEQQAPVAEGQGNENAELKDRFLRLAAEFDNYKKRMAKDLDNSKDLGRAEVLVRLLPTLDEFELALGSFNKDDEHLKGVALIFSNFMSTLKSLGLQEIDTKGKFDPYRHEIVMSRESDAADGEILEVVRKGYMVNKIMIRPASVIIAKNDGAGKQEEQKEKKSE